MSTTDQFHFRCPCWYFAKAKTYVFKSILRPSKNSLLSWRKVNFCIFAMANKHIDNAIKIVLKFCKYFTAAGNNWMSTLDWKLMVSDLSCHWVRSCWIDLIEVTQCDVFFNNSCIDYCIILLFGQVLLFVWLTLLDHTTQFQIPFKKPKFQSPKTLQLDKFKNSKYLNVLSGPVFAVWNGLALKARAHDITRPS